MTTMFPFIVVIVVIVIVVIVIIDVLWLLFAVILTDDTNGRNSDKTIFIALSRFPFIGFNRRSLRLPQR